VCDFYIMKQFVGYVRSDVFVSQPRALRAERDVNITSRDVIHVITYSLNDILTKSEIFVNFRIHVHYFEESLLSGYCF
jgi:hypothetical protein